ncbi:formate dehydrogenase accessory sulfurtransferase FdhD [soil metagenome]
MEGQRRSQTKIRITVVNDGEAKARPDLVATEEPLEIRLGFAGTTQRVAVTMRTPGNDFELAAGFLFAEGIVQSRDQIATIGYCVDRELTPEQRYNVVTVDLRSAVSELEARRFGVTSACGVCGKESLDQIERRGTARIPNGFTISPETIVELPDRLRAAQGIFESTGGLHAAGLFTGDGELIALREDVGRHNALDKLIGTMLLEDKLPLNHYVILVSGRTSFELAQKCAAAGVSVLCSVSAPSSLAIEVARKFNLTLIGFLRGAHFNIYHGAHRIL